MGVKSKVVLSVVGCIALLALAIATCGFGSSVRGTITYGERITLTPGATVTVQIRDTSYVDASAPLVAEQVIEDPGQVPIEFRIPFSRDDIDPHNTYSISARIDESDGRLAFINDTAYEVITRGSPTQVDLVLVMVEPPTDMVDGEWSAADGAPVEEPVSVTGTHMIWEGDEASVRIVYLVSDIEGCYRRGREEATVVGRLVEVSVTAWVPPPAPWSIDCSGRNLELDAIMFLGDSLLAGETYRVAVNGEPTLTFTAR